MKIIDAEIEVINFRNGLMLLQACGKETIDIKTALQFTNAVHSTLQEKHQNINKLHERLDAYKNMQAHYKDKLAKKHSVSDKYNSAFTAGNINALQQIMDEL